MTEKMKRYEAETGEMATWNWHCRDILTDDYIAWLEAQLTWQPVSEKLPSVEKDGDAVIARLKDLDDGLVQFDVVSTLWFISKYESWYTHWLPIPPAPEA